MSMKRVLFVLGLLLLPFSASIAALRTAEEAAELAWRQVVLSAGTSGRKAPARAALTLVQTAPAYYAFNTGAGFVLVGADDRACDILGWSDTGSFCPDSLPDNMRWWLACYDEQAALLSDDTAGAAVPARAVEAAAAVTRIGPLLTCNWNQNAPFNDRCPEYATGKTSAAGCVAVAVGQIMYYHKYPEHGIGSYSYLWYNADSTISRTLQADFAATTYQWADMTDKPAVASSNKVKSAVSTLLYHVGVASNMSYGASSSAVPNKAASALVSRFGYDSSLKPRLQRKNYTDDAWETLLRNELDAGRPVLYSGWGEVDPATNKRPGHSFVCDGYDSQGLFHINWGWGGSSDGWFRTALMNPQQQGIGGSTGKYSENQEIAIGIQPPQSAPQIRCDSISVSDTVFACGAPLTLTVNGLINYGVDDLGGLACAVALKNELTGEVVALPDSLTQTSLASFSRADLLFPSFRLPASLPDGWYRFVPLCAEAEKVCTAYNTFLGMQLGCKTYAWQRTAAWRELPVNSSEPLLIRVYGGQAERINMSAPAVLQLAGRPSFPDSARVYRTGAQFSYTLTCIAGRFEGEVRAFLYSGSFARGNAGEAESLCLLQGQTLTKTVTADLTQAEGDYLMKLKYRPSGTSAWQDLQPAANNGVGFRLYNDLPVEPDVRLSAPLAFVGPDSVSADSLRVCWKLTNSGAPFSGQVEAFVSDAFGDTICRSLAWPVMLAMDSSRADTVLIPCVPSLAPGSYVLALRQRLSAASPWTDMEPVQYAALSFAIPQRIVTATDGGDANCNLICRYSEKVVFLQADCPLQEVQVFAADGRCLLACRPGTSAVSLPLSADGVCLILVRTRESVYYEKIIAQ